MASRYLYIAAMGFIGALLRVLVETLLPLHGFPVATLVINVLACFLLEIVYSFVGRRLSLPGNLVNAMGVGLIGSFSTMSAFALDTVRFFQQGEPVLGLLNIVITLLGCFLAAVAGDRLSAWLTHRRISRTLERGSK